MRVPEGSSKIANHPWPMTSDLGEMIFPPAFLTFSTWTMLPGFGCSAIDISPTTHEASLIYNDAPEGKITVLDRTHRTPHAGGVALVTVMPISIVHGEAGRDGLSCNLEIEHGRLHRPHQLDPDRQDHLGPAGRRDVPEVDHLPPAEAPEDFRHLGLRIGVVTAHEDIVVAFRHQVWTDHDHVGHRVQGLDDLGLGEGPLDLLAERIRVAHDQRRGHPLREVERVRDVDQDLAGEIPLPREAQRLDGGRSRRGVDKDFTVCGGIRKWRELRLRMRLDPHAERRIPHVVRLRVGHGLCHLARAEHHVMAELHEFAADRSPHRPRSQDTDLQGYAPDLSTTPRYLCVSAEGTAGVPAQALVPRPSSASNYTRPSSFSSGQAGGVTSVRHRGFPGAGHLPYSPGSVRRV